MSPRNQHGWIGLDIGASSVKLAQVVRQGGKLRLEEAAMVVRQEGWQEVNLAEMAPRSSADELQTVLANAPRCEGRASAALLPTAACEWNNTTVASDETNPLSAIAEEFTVIGIDLRGRVFDYWAGLPLGRGGKTNQKGIHILSTSCDWSDRLAGDLVRVGLDCRAIDGLPLALARAVGEVDRTTGKMLAAIDWGYSGATFVLLDAGQPVYVRQLKQTAFRETVSHVAEELDLSEEEAGELLRVTSALPPHAEDMVAIVLEKIIEPAIVALTGELERTLHYLQSIGKRLAPQRIYLFGGGATLPGIGHCLTERLSREVFPWKLDAESEEIAASKSLATCLLGPAVALSALRWKSRT